MLLYNVAGGVKMKISQFNYKQIMGTQNFEVYHYKDSYFHSLDFHSHDFYELYFFIDGSVMYYIEEKTFELIPGDVLIIPPGKMHRPVISDTEAVYERIVLWVNAGFLNSISDESCSLIDTLYKMSIKKNHLIHFENSDFSYLVDILSKLIQNSDSEDFGNKLLNKAFISIITIMINRQLFSSSVYTLVQEDLGIIPEIITYINENLSSSLSVEDISNKFFISKYHLIRKFKKYTNATMYDYIISKRIILAKKMMQNGESSTDACQLCGFCDYSNFYKSFTKKTGLTPKEYKAMCTIENRK